MKNLNKVRTAEQHKVGRVIRFKDKTEMHLFILLYNQKFGQWNFDETTMYITIRKEDFNSIVNDYGLILDKPRHGKKVRFWRTEAAGE